jgi:hypothetical protein
MWFKKHTFKSRSLKSEPRSTHFGLRQGKTNTADLNVVSYYFSIQLLNKLISYYRLSILISPVPFSRPRSRSLIWGKVRTKKITTLKTKKNIEKIQNHQNIESVHLFSIKVIRMCENLKYQLPMAYYLWLPKPVGG